MAMMKNKVHLKNRIIQNIRRLTWAWKPIKDAQDDAKVDKALYECKSCGKYIYDGKSAKSEQKLKDKYPKKKVEMGVVYKDHIEPVIPLDKQTKDVSFDEIIGRMFCEKDGIQILCKACHDEKTDEEKEQRKKYKEKKK